MTILRVQHIGAVVSDYETARRAFDRLALPLRDFRNDQGRGFQHDGRILFGNECWLHVVYNWSPESRVNRFLATRGEGLEHLALETDDIEADVAHLKELGVPIFDDHIFDANDGFEAFVFPEDAIGFTIELIQPHSTSWVYPDDARARPVSDELGIARLAQIHANVDDVAGAKRRLREMFGLQSPSENESVPLGDNASLHLNEREPIGLECLVVETKTLDEDAVRLEGRGVSVERDRPGLARVEACGVPIELVATSRGGPRR